MVDLERRNSKSQSLELNMGPSPDEIRKATAEIRRNWTNSERRRRSVGHGMASYDDAWMPPQILTSQCLARVRKIVAEAV